MWCTAGIWMAVVWKCYTHTRAHTLTLTLTLTPTPTLTLTLTLTHGDRYMCHCVWQMFFRPSNGRIITQTIAEHQKPFIAWSPIGSRVLLLVVLPERPIAKCQSHFITRKIWKNMETETCLSARNLFATSSLSEARSTWKRAFFWTHFLKAQRVFVHFWPRTSVFRGVGVRWDGANNVPWNLTRCYASTCGYATRTWVSCCADRRCCYACTCGYATRVGWGGVGWGAWHSTCCYASTCGYATQTWVWCYDDRRCCSLRLCWLYMVKPVDARLQDDRPLLAMRRLD